MPTWEQQLWDYLCALLKARGLNCSSLPPRPSSPSSGSGTLPQAIDVVLLAYETLGIPTFPGMAEQTAFLDLLDLIEAHLNNPVNSLPPAADAKLRAFIAQMRAAFP